MPIDVCVQQAPCGALVHGLDLCAPVSGTQLTELRSLWLNHQVLAYGYEWIAPLGDVCIRIYDPNYPGDDTVTLTLKLDDLESGDQ